MTNVILQDILYIIWCIEICCAEIWGFARKFQYTISVVRGRRKNIGGWFMEKLFKLKEHNTTVKTEIIDRKSVV